MDSGTFSILRPWASRWNEGVLGIDLAVYDGQNFLFHALSFLLVVSCLVDKRLGHGLVGQ